MRLLLIVAAALTCLTISCSSPKKAAGDLDQNASKPSDQKLIITPSKALSGRVLRVNNEAKFVVLSFPVGNLPALEQRLNVYRGGLKTAELKVSGPQYDDKIVADVVSGTAQVGDEVRDQ